MRLNLMSQAGAAGATALQLPKASFRLPLVTAMLTLEARDESSATQAQLNGECSLISRLRWISRDGLRQQQLGRGLWRRTRGGADHDTAIEGPQDFYSKTHFAHKSDSRFSR
jgi:hypothetical protein